MCYLANLKWLARCFPIGVAVCIVGIVLWKIANLVVCFAVRCKTTIPIIDRDLFFAVDHCCDRNTVKRAEACARKRTNYVA